MNELKNAMAEVRQNLIDFEQKLVRTSSLTGHEEDAARLVLAEMQKLSFDEAKIDSSVHDFPDSNCSLLS